jgi:diketogulonate reductase-like aldo/keto reductase
MYGQGEVERIVGEAIEGRRDQVFLVSKVVPSNATYKGTRDACERSLARLGTDRLDSYLLHWPGDELEETIRAFTTLVDQGKILSWGLSNFDAKQLEEAQRIAGPGRIACNQVLYHLEERAIEHEVLPWCKAQHVAVVAYSPLGQGSLPSPSSKGGHVLADIAAAHGATPAEVALAFLVRDESVVTIPKACKPAHVAHNARAGDLILSPEELAAIDRAFPLGPRPRTLPML